MMLMSCDGRAQSRDYILYSRPTAFWFSIAYIQIRELREIAFNFLQLKYQQETVGNILFEQHTVEYRVYTIVDYRFFFFIAGRCTHTGINFCVWSIQGRFRILYSKFAFRLHFIGNVQGVPSQMFSAVLKLKILASLSYFSDRITGAQHILIIFVFGL